MKLKNRSSTNKRCLEKLKDDLKDTNPANNYCAYHTLSNSGKKSTVVAKYTEKIRNKFHKCIQYPGKTWNLARGVFDETILDSGGVRLFLRHEQCCQIETHGL